MVAGNDLGNEPQGKIERIAHVLEPTRFQMDGWLPGWSGYEEHCAVNSRIARSKVWAIRVEVYERPACPARQAN